MNQIYLLFQQLSQIYHYE